MFSKTEVLLFGRRRRVLFKTHFENRMASAKGALQRVASLSNSNGGLSVSLMRRVVVAAVTSVALYGSEIWWRGQQDRVNKLQLLLNRQARTITGLLRSTPLAFLRDQACLPPAKDLLDQRQTRYAIRALSADGDHPTHQLLPAGFRPAELYGYEETTVQPSSIGWTRLEKTHRLCGSRLAQQVIKHKKYDVEHGFDLPCRRDPPDPGPVIRMYEHSRLPVRMLPNHPQQTRVFVEVAKDVGFGVGAAWKERDGWKSRATPLGRYLSDVDAASFAISMALECLPAILLKTDHRRAEVATKSRLALEELQNTRSWVLRTVADARRHAERVREEGGAVAITWLPYSTSSNGGKIASLAAQRTAKQPSKAMRSASLSYVKQAVRNKWKLVTKLNRHIKDTKKSVAARYLQLKSGHTITGAHLMRIGKVVDARCWWCKRSEQTVAHLFLECRKWRTERETMMQKLRDKEVTTNETTGRRNVKTLFGDNAVVDVLEFNEKTEVGKRPAGASDEADSWDIERLDRNGDEERDGG
jgi:hypothetical protein